ncbi:3'-phosphoadenylsulfate reductase [Diatrype stigma]|uniref:phosphoadenylyl-sulfate reductase (thioredoxin) n=1 Tax=Diatrype stigma TaxID=117547 RepID=A0AAN9YN98_9PEZI
MTSPTRTEASSSASSPVIKALGDSKVDVTDVESGYGSATSSVASSISQLPQIVLTKPHIKHLNKQLEKMEAVDRLRFVKLLFPNLYQSTAFGLTGLVTIDMLSKLQQEESDTTPVDIIFLDTLYHFQETLDLVEQVKAKYPGARIHTYQPDGASTAAEFEERYGARLYETAPELYDWIAKVEPQQRSYSDLGVAAVLTGRRRSQGGERDQIQFLEVDEERGIIKVNPLVDWTFGRVKAYIDEHRVPYNALLDRGYKSVGDWHSTSPVGAAEDERAGRWRGQAKTECGIHNKKSRYAQFLQAQQQKDEGEEKLKLAAALGKVEKEQQQQTPVQVV